ncbi:hypothetical protein EJB05_45586 [Eragrostis curvula]|uniref:SHSP domain-containing protein n=1 Tax=Eragrostis curvula TaxID=38414 RepID=A0A5J9TL15_9POAL|nr:hypothetical protein EJB05_45586 [Eragrostis curvula]
MSMTPWLGELGAMDMDRFAGGDRDDATAVARTNVDWRETDKEHILTAEIPGVRKEDVKVDVEDGAVLKISGEKAREAAEEQQQEEGGSWKRVERSYGSFLRRFRLPDGAWVDGIRCTLEDGVLRVVVPKDDQSRTRRDVQSIDVS